MDNRDVQNTDFANIPAMIRNDKLYGGDKCRCRSSQDLPYLRLRNMSYNGVIIASLVFTPKRIIGATCMIWKKPQHTTRLRYTPMS